VAGQHPAHAHRPPRLGLVTSTPRGADDFHQLYLYGQQGRDGWASWRMPTSSNPHIPAGEIEAARDELPDIVFRQEYLGEPADDLANPFGTEAIRAVCTLDEPTNAPPAAWGVDLAKSPRLDRGYRP